MVSGCTLNPTEYFGINGARNGVALLGEPAPPKSISSVLRGRDVVVIEEIIAVVTAQCSVKPDQFHVEILHS